jgi:Uma2 family endonuclease
MPNKIINLLPVMQSHKPNIISKLPPRNALEVFEMLPEGTLAEVIDNTIYMPPSPDFWHQDTSATLHTLMNMHVTTQHLGKCIAAPMDVYLDDRNIVQPDILFISAANLSIVKDAKIKGTPDLFVEIISGNRKYDKKTKKDLYEAFRVIEYFIVDPANKEVITYYHDGNKFVKQESKRGRIASRLLDKEFAF